MKNYVNDLKDYLKEQDSEEIKLSSFGIDKNHPCSYYELKVEILNCKTLVESLPKLKINCKKAKSNNKISPNHVNWHQDQSVTQACDLFQQTVNSVPKRPKRKGQCLKNHHPEDDYCIPNKCTCDNGKPLPSHLCLGNGLRVCHSCDDGFSLNQKTKSCMHDSSTGCVTYSVSDEKFTGWSRQQFRSGVNSWDYFVKADTFCERQGLKRASVRNIEEYRMLDRLLGKIKHTVTVNQDNNTTKQHDAYRHFGFWLGGRRKVGLRQDTGFGTGQNTQYKFSDLIKWPNEISKQTFIWNDNFEESNQVSCNFWQRKQPNHGFSPMSPDFDEDCLLFEPSDVPDCKKNKCPPGGAFRFNDVYCHAEYQVVCEKRTCVPDCDVPNKRKFQDFNMTRSEVETDFDFDYEFE